MRSRFERSGLRLSSVALIAFFVVAGFVMPFIPSARAATTNVTIADFAFSPKTINIQIGDTVVWTNNGPSQHTVTSDGGAGPLNSGTLNVGNTYEWTFLAAGSFGYHCTIHPSMTGTVNVGAIPEFSDFALVALGMLVVILGLIAVGKKR